MLQNIFFSKNSKRRVQAKICLLINCLRRLEVSFKSINQKNLNKIKNNKIFNDKIAILKKIFGR